MTPRTIYFDESGFTGSNLLDPAQPVFAIASAAIEEQRAADILAEAFPNYQGPEYKFANIWNGTQRSGLLRLAAHLCAFEHLAFIYAIDKRFAVLTKIADFLIEPCFTDAGYDFYDEGFCWKYTNYIHFGLTTFAPPTLLTTLVANYQRFSRNPSEQTLAALADQLGLMRRSVEKELTIFFEQMELGARLFTKYNDLATFKQSNELQSTTMAAIIAHWRQRFSEDFAVVHDASSNFLRGKDIWDRITNSNVPKQMHRLGDGSYVEFPLRVVSTTPMNSLDSRAVQFCDILAGVGAKYFDPRTAANDREFMNSLIEAGISNIPYNGIRPQPVFPDRIPPKRLTGPDTVDQMTRIIFGRHNDKR
ncbi:DUF3800 domain-containing protein [Hyphomicrobium sp. MC8b]|uniref:DUF3800 domain-containing protein n=1 Tax=Hyphomicrobium sp. MC8b TaxID=300273 RepID=UPI00391A46B9